MDETVLDAPIETVASPDTGSESTTEETPLESAQPQKTPPEGEKADNRKNPDALRRALKFLRENGGEHSERAQDLERMLGETKSYKTVYPTVREAREAKLAIDAVGGTARIAEMQQSVAHMAEVDAMLEAGDPRVLDEIFEQSAKGIAKLLPKLLEKVGESSPAEYAKTMTPHAVSFMDSQGLPGAIDAAVREFNSGNHAKAGEILSQIVGWYKGLANQGAQGAKSDPEREAFEAEKATFAQDRYKGEVSTVFNQVIDYAQTVLDKNLAVDVKRLGLSPESAALLREDAWKYLQAERNKGTIFKAAITSKINDSRRTVSPDAVKFLNSQTDDLAKAACERAVKLRYGHLGNGAKAAVTTPEGKSSRRACWIAA